MFIQRVHCYYNSTLASLTTGSCPYSVPILNFPPSITAPGSISILGAQQSPFHLAVRVMITGPCDTTAARTVP